MLRKGMDLPAREGVEVDVSDGDSLDLATELVAPWAEENLTDVSPGKQAATGIGILVLEILRDGGMEKLLDQVQAATEDVEPSVAAEDLPEKDPDF